VYKDKKEKVLPVFILTLRVSLFWVYYGFGEPLVRVSATTSRPQWGRFKIVAWQYQTSLLQDIDLYRRIGLSGFHIIGVVPIFD
jgi:hypothetical protein